MAWLQVAVGSADGAVHCKTGAEAALLVRATAWTRDVRKLSRAGHTHRMPVLAPDAQDGAARVECVLVPADGAQLALPLHHPFGHPTARSHSDAGVAMFVWAPPTL